MKLFKIVLLVALIAGLFVSAPIDKARAAIAYETCFQVQNLDVTDGTLLIQYFPQDANQAPISPATSPTISASGSYTACPITPSSGFNGSAVISSDVPIAAIVNVTGGGWGKYDASYDGFSTGALTVNLPLLFKNSYQYNTWFNIQNAGGSSTAHVKLTYSTGLEVNYTIEPNRAITVKQVDEAGLGNGVFAATVTSDQPIVVAAMEEGPTMLFGYDGFPDASLFPVMPLVQENHYGYTSGVQLQNTGTVPTTVTVNYIPSLAGTACSETQTIQPAASATFALNAFAANDTAPTTNTCANGSTFVGSAVVSGNTGSVGLVGIVNQHNFAAKKGAAYGTINPDNATDTVVLPLIMDRNYGFFTGFNIVNVGTAATTVDCTFSNSTYDFAAVTLAPGQAVTAVQGLAAGQTNLGAGYVGSAICKASDPTHKIASIVNELQGASTGDSFLVYEGFSK